ncbi:hypothetical protein [Neptuniibacter sp. QD37_11]|uniref:hypothetical protein n=1 Tax=Neptuniibacter sp. QD37_11 TaxID=3398209 RepID=UPI0039F5C11A
MCQIKYPILSFAGYALTGLTSYGLAGPSLLTSLWLVSFVFAAGISIYGLALYGIWLLQGLKPANTGSAGISLQHEATELLVFQYAGLAGMTFAAAFLI